MENNDEELKKVLLELKETENIPKVEKKKNISDTFRNILIIMISIDVLMIIPIFLMFLFENSIKDWSFAEFYALLIGPLFPIMLVLTFVFLIMFLISKI